MLLLWAYRSVSVSELMRRLQVSTATLPPLLKRLENGGLLTRRRTDDERLVQVRITTPGMDLLDCPSAERTRMTTATGMPDPRFR